LSLPGEGKGFRADFGILRSFSPDSFKPLLFLFQISRLFPLELSSSIPLTFSFSLLTVGFFVPFFWHLPTGIFFSWNGRRLCFPSLFLKLIFSFFFSADYIRYPLFYFFFTVPGEFPSFTFFRLIYFFQRGLTIQFFLSFLGAFSCSSLESCVPVSPPALARDVLLRVPLCPPRRSSSAAYAAFFLPAPFFLTYQGRLFRPFSLPLIIYSERLPF